MKQIVLMIAMVALVGGCASTPTNPNWVSDPSDPINVKIEKAIREELKKPIGELTKADLEKVTGLSLFNNQLTDVKGLEKLTQLTMLNLGANQLTDVKGLEKLTQLNQLWLDGTQLTDVTGLENLTQLKVLILSRNQLTEVPKGLEKLTQLRSLYLGNNKLTNLKGLEKLTKLTDLDLAFNYALTYAQIDELQKALPECLIYSNPAN